MASISGNPTIETHAAHEEVGTTPTVEQLAAQERLRQIADDLKSTGFIDDSTPQAARAQGPSLFGRFISCLQELPFRVILVCDRIISFNMNFCFFTLNLIVQSNIEICRALTRQTQQIPQTPPKPAVIQRV